MKEAVDMSNKPKDRTYRPLVYICSPLSGDVEANTERARAFCRFALAQGQIPLASHLLFPHFMDDDDPAKRELAIFMDIVLLGKCSELWVLGETVKCRQRSMWRKSADSRSAGSTVSFRRWSHYEWIESY